MFDSFVPCLLISVIVIIVLTIWLKTPQGKGIVGELNVKFHLGRNIKNKKYIINNLIITGENGQTSQIDHILINSKGVFVIETKNYVGRIYGNEHDNEWTQVLQYGNVKNKFYNPIKQNATHIYRIKQALDIKVPLYSVVVFTKADIHYVNTNNIFNVRSMKQYIKKVPSILRLDGEQISSIYQKLISIKKTCTVSSREHIKNIKQMKDSVKNGICPRCGEKLVERNGKNGNFLGCSAFPKCKFTKKL